MDDLARYREGAYLRIDDALMATEYVSMTADVEEGMIVQVRHNFGTYLVCEPTTVADSSAVVPVPPGSGEFTDERPADEQTQYR